MDQIRRVRNDLDRYAAPADLALWDTEVNYEVDRPGGAPDGRITGDKAAAWTAQTYLNGWRNGLRRTFWYLWTADYYPFPGIQMRPPTRRPRPADAGHLGHQGHLHRLPDRHRGGHVLVRPGRRGHLRHRLGDRGARAIRLPAEVSVCPVTGDPCTTESGRYRLNEVPVRMG